jgi:hypothetical protein
MSTIYPKLQPQDLSRFRDVKKFTEGQLLLPIKKYTPWANTLDEDQRRHLKTTWRLADPPAVKAYIVDEKLLDDLKAFKLGAPFF